MRLFHLASAVVAIALVAASAPAAYAACSPGSATPQKISDFRANPSSLLEGSGGPRANADIVNDVRDLVVSDPTTLPAVIGLLKTDPPPSAEFQRAIGTGLGLAANVCIRPDPAFASEIQASLAATTSTDAKQQYAAVTGNQLIGAIGGGAGGLSAGASGGQTGPLANFNGGGSLVPFVANSVSNTSPNYFGGGTASITYIGTPTNIISNSTP